MSCSNNTSQGCAMPTLDEKQLSLSAPGTEAFEDDLCHGIPCVTQINNDTIIKSDKKQRVKFGLANPTEEPESSSFSLVIAHKDYGVVAASFDVLAFQVQHGILSWDVRSLVADFAGNRISDLSKASIHLRELFAQEPRWEERGICLTFTISNATSVRIWKLTSPEAGMQDCTLSDIDPQSQALIDTVEDPYAAYKLRVWLLLPEEKVDEYNGEWITKLHQLMKWRTP